MPATNETHRRNEKYLYIFLIRLKIKNERKKKEIKNVLLTFLLPTIIMRSLGKFIFFSHAVVCVTFGKKEFIDDGIVFLWGWAKRRTLFSFFFFCFSSLFLYIHINIFIFKNKKIILFKGKSRLKRIREKWQVIKISAIHTSESLALKLKIQKS
jgi:hypothetical protein